MQFTYDRSISTIKGGEKADEKSNGDSHLEELIEYQGHHSICSFVKLPLLVAEINLSGEDEVDAKVYTKKNIARQGGRHGAKATREEECVEEGDNISNHQLY